jgi:hypothetical protein
MFLRLSTISALAVMTALTVSLVLTQFALADTSACVKCHTDEETLKSLYQVPKIDAGEGAG